MARTITGSPPVRVLTPQQRFVASASPAQWASTAHELRYSARLLWEREHFSLTFTSPFGSRQEGKSMISRTSLLLYALAIENMLKAISISMDPSLVSRSNLNSQLTHHDLIRIAQTASRALSADEERLCQNLSEAIQSWGRYPTSLDMNSLTDEQVTSQDMVERIEVLLSNLNDDLVRTLLGGWDGGDGVKITLFEPRPPDSYFVVYEITSRRNRQDEKQVVAWSFGPPQP